MTRINLAELPKCGAMTRKGTPCQRPGNKTNGRCRLHGGSSTGPTTKAGKAISRNNASKAFPDELFNGKANAQYLTEAHSAYTLLHHLMSQQEINWQEVHTTVERYRVPLEYAKYRITEFSEPYALAIIQTALDRYYQDNDSAHLRFHAFEGMLMLPMFYRQLTKSQQARLDKWFSKQHLPWEEPQFLKKFEAYLRCEGVL
ncbi:HGGxSTG domain-containing protein [Vibrio sp. 10N.239.311.G01]|uniref:HGGxSTG domain-containing protein n=1 Tax=Vibrio sp. 10N.239.311.G01 TaxID=3229976 RepID=UPI00354C8EA1